MDDELAESLANEAIEVSCEMEIQKDALTHCMTKLNERDRTLINQRYEEDTAVAKIAEASGKSRMAVYKVLNRIHRDLMQCIDHFILKEEGGLR